MLWGCFGQNLSRNVLALILQVGIWDINGNSFQDGTVNRNDFQDVIGGLLPKFRQFLKAQLITYRNLFKSGRVRLLVMSPPSLPDRAHNLKRRSLKRNNWISAVFAFELRKSMQSLAPIVFFEEFSFTFPLFWYTPDYPNHHYLLWDYMKHQCNGRIGKAYLALITKTLCPGIKMH